MVSKLIKMGADIEARNERGETPIWDALWNGGDLMTVSALIDLGANVNVLSQKLQYFPLHHAVKEGKVDIVRKLVASGANVHAITADGKNALELADKSRPSYDAIAGTFYQEERRTKKGEQKTINNQRDNE